MTMFLFGVFILITSVSNSLSAKHVWIQTGKTWLEARTYCRTHFTDLSPISCPLEDRVFRSSLSQTGIGWIGLYRDPNSLAEWKWSGGANATFMDWADQTSRSSDYVYWTQNGWRTSTKDHYAQFFCLNMIVVVEVRKTWEEALEHCRETGSDLGSLSSETEHLLATRAIVRRGSTVSERVWLGLRYLGERWLWVNGERTRYQAWPQGDDQCPVVSKRCGALTKQGHWENWDCADKLNFICI